MIEGLRRDGLTYALAAVVGRGVSFLLVPIYTRLLDPVGYGTLELILTGGLLVNLVVALEVGQGLAREYSEHSEPAKRRSLASTALSFTVLAHGIFLALSWLGSKPLALILLGSESLEADVRAGAIFIAANAVFLQLQNQLRWSFRARSYAAVSALFGGLTIGCGAALGEAFGVQGVLWGQAAAAGASCLATVVLLWGDLSLALHRKELADMLRFSLPLVPSGLALFAAFYVNRLLLSTLASLHEVGLFGVGQRLAGVTTLLIAGLQGALTPLVYRHHREPDVPVQLAGIFERFVVVGMVVCSSMSVFAEEIVRLLAGPGFDRTSLLLPWLAPAALLSQMYIFAPGIGVARKTGWQLVITCMSAVLAVGLNCLLIPQWGAWGAALASCVAAAVFFTCWMVVSQRFYELPMRWQSLGVAVVMYVGAVWLGRGIRLFDLPAEWALLAKTSIIVSFGLLLMMTGLLRRNGER